jgi:hypothetical protein
MNYLRTGLCVGQITLWCLAIAGLLGVIALIGLRDPDLTKLREDSHPVFFMLSFGAISLLNMITKMFCKGCGTIFHCLFWPAECALYIALIPISFVVFIIFMVFHTFSWAVIVGSLCIPLFIAWLFLPKSCTKLILSTRNDFYQNRNLQYCPGIFGILFLFDESTPNYVKMIATLGACFDCVVLSIAWSIVLGIACCGLACGIMYYIYPMSLESVSNNIVSSAGITQLWILSKVIQIIVALAIPILRLVANKKLKNFKALVDFYFELITASIQLLINRFIVVLIDDILKAHRNSELDDLIAKAKQRIAEETVLIEKLQELVEEEIGYIAEEIFDFDFDQGMRVKDAEELTNPLMKGSFTGSNM